MARIDFEGAETAAVMPGVNAGESYFRLGLAFSSDAEGNCDRIAAHKWFNVAAARGYRPAVDYRREIAGEMNDAEVREALRQAREYLTLH